MTNYSTIAHHVLRDAYAVRHNGRTEVRVGQDSIDVLIPGDTHDTLVEVKPVAKLREAIGQLNSYQRRHPRPSQKLLVLFQEGHWLAEADKQRIATHTSSGELSTFRLELFPPVRVPEHYQLAGLQFPTKSPASAIGAEVKAIKRQFQRTGQISEDQSDFLWELVCGGQPYGRGIASARLAWGERGVCLQVTCTGSPDPYTLSTSEAARRWLRMANYRCVYGGDAA